MTASQEEIRSMKWWPFGTREEASLTAEQRVALQKLVANPKYELIPLKKVRDAAEALPPGARVTVTASPAHGLETTLEVSEFFAARGHEVTPHLSARMVRDRAHLTDLLARSRAIGLRTVFVVGGDAENPGEFQDGLALLRAMHEIGHPFDEVGVPAYPEGHVNIADDVLLKVLKEKQQYARYMATQMAFNPEAVATWLTRMREEGITLALDLGVLGVVELTKLMTIAAKIGVADSARYLNKNRGLVGALTQPGSFGPDAFLKALAPMLADSEAGVRGLHMFTMNQVASTAAWQQRMLEELRA
jgi:methylenetetrahydrofolate reductase (NADPH)